MATDRKVERAWMPELPGTVVLRDSLRLMRHVAFEGRHALGDAVERAGEPVAGVATFALSGADRVVGPLIEASDDLVSRVLGGDDLQDVDLDTIERGDDADAAFARAAYSALSQILAALGARDAYIPETRLRRAHARAARTTGPDPELSLRAAMILVEMERAEVIADLEMERGIDLSRDKVGRTALFALVLWLLSDREAGEARAALDAAIALALALSDDAAACDGDPGALARLLDEFRHHV